MEELVDGEAADGGVEEFDHVEGGKLGGAAAAKAAHELQKAAGIGADDGFGSGGEQVRDLAVAEFVGGFGMQEVVDACGAAAERCFGDLFDFELGDLREKSARLRARCLVRGGDGRRRDRRREVRWASAERWARRRRELR